MPILNREHPEIAAVEVAWEGDSLEVMRSFPGPERQDLSAELRRLQKGNRLLNSRPMPSIGNRIYELKEQDERAWYRVIYLAKIGNRIYVLHCSKKSRPRPARMIGRLPERD
jgi:phage-related protein